MCSSGYTGKYCVTKVSFLLYLEHLSYLAIYVYRSPFSEGRGTSTAVLAEQ